MMVANEIDLFDSSATGGTYVSTPTQPVFKFEHQDKFDRIDLQWREWISTFKKSDAESYLKIFNDEVKDKPVVEIPSTYKIKDQMTDADFALIEEARQVQLNEIFEIKRLRKIELKEALDKFNKLGAPELSPEAPIDIEEFVEELSRLE